VRRQIEQQMNDLISPDRSRLADLVRFYEILATLENKIGPPRRPGWLDAISSPRCARCQTLQHIRASVFSCAVL
jgi:hypothetical protein